MLNNAYYAYDIYVMIRWIYMYIAHLKDPERHYFFVSMSADNRLHGLSVTFEEITSLARSRRSGLDIINSLSVWHSTAGVAERLIGVVPRDCGMQTHLFIHI